jgi:membrane-associated phospholipid phosphatase
MLLWAGLVLLAFGTLSFAIDRRATHFFHDRLTARWFRRIRHTTDFAKGAHWLAAAIAVIALAWVFRQALGDVLFIIRLWRTAVAFLACLAVASVLLHSIKLVFGRRRPRDELEHDLYEFRLFHYDSQHDSFPSGHAMTIFCVAVILAAATPSLALLWFGLALYLALTRAVLNAHFLSDVLVGAAIGLLASRETILFLFADLARAWF